MPDYSTQTKPYAAAIRKLLKGVVYHDDAVWSQIRDYKLPIQEYFAKIGLELHIDEIGSFAYLYDKSREGEEDGGLPALTTRRSLSFSDTLLLVLLRERLDEHEMRDLDGMTLLLNAEDMVEMFGIFIADHPDERKIEQTVKTSINKLQRYGFLTERKDRRYEVRPLLRAKISADELDDIRLRLEWYARQSNTVNEEDDDA
jgi:hypothetical protein